MYDAFDDPYAYPGTDVLQNLPNIQDPQELEAFEVEISTLRTEEPLPQGCVCLAGQYRTVRTSKAGNSFCYPEYIQDRMTDLFKRFKNGQRFAERETKEFVSLAAEFLGELNAIHPFREGNGRAQLVFLGLLGETFGHPFHFERLDRDSFLPSMIASFSGQMAPLIRELTNLIT